MGDAHRRGRNGGTRGPFSRVSEEILYGVILPLRGNRDQVQTAEPLAFRLREDSLGRVRGRQQRTHTYRICLRTCSPHQKSRSLRTRPAWMTDDTDRLAQAADEGIYFLSIYLFIFTFPKGDEEYLILTQKINISYR
jgi:hypothetical protein